MAAPDYVPVLPQDRPREAESLPPPRAWVPNRPGDFVRQRAHQPSGPTLGHPGPDLGYALALVHRLESRLQLAPGERLDDVVAGCVGIAMKRASLFGRAPVIYDLEVAFGLWGFLTENPPADLVDERRRLFEAASHHYAIQRAIVDRVPEQTLRLTPAQINERLSSWPTLLAP